MTRSVPLIYLVAGEASGDLLAARVMAALKEEINGEVRFAGVGGPLMEAEGLESLFPMSELSVLGIVEVLPQISKLLRRMKEVRKDAKAKKPDLFLSVDAPSFSLRVAKSLKSSGFPLVHYVAPTVWAWKPGRAYKISRYLDHLLALFPFEPPYFECHNLSTTFVGHSALEAPSSDCTAAEMAESLSLPADTRFISVLPGSRRAEIDRLSGIFGEALSLLDSKDQKLQVLVPTVPHVAEQVRAAVKGWPYPVTVLTDPLDKYRAFAASRAALAASGTVALELGVAGVPAVIGYRVNALTAFIVRRLIRTPYVALPNIVLKREIQPELLQENCKPKNLASSLQELLQDGPQRDRHLAALKDLRKEISGQGEGTPSQQAARCLLRIIGLN